MSDNRTKQIRLQADTFVRLERARDNIHQWANEAASTNYDVPIVIGEPSYDQVISMLLTLWETHPSNGRAR